MRLRKKYYVLMTVMLCLSIVLFAMLKPKPEDNY